MFKKNTSLIIYLLILLFFGSCNNICKNEIIKIEISPDGKYKAIAFIRSCGATTSFSPQVLISRQSISFSDKDIGNIFIGNHSKDINIYWESSTCLIILHNSAEKDVFTKISKYENIDIKYIFSDDVFDERNLYR